MSLQNWYSEFDKFWLEHLKVSKIYTLIGCFWLKYIMFELKKYRGVIFHDTREWCKIWRKTDLWFRKWHEEFGKLSPKHTKVPKLGLLLGAFIQSRKCTSLDIYRGVTCYDSEEWCKIWKGIALLVQNWHEEFNKFWPEHSKISQIWTVMVK